MAKFCDDRYGHLTSEAEECFEDLRRFYKIEFGPDVDGIVNYCENTYKTKPEIDACKEEFAGFFGGSE